MWATAISGYTAVGTGLYFSWYRQFDQEAFHFFDDLPEWLQMDKAGHVYSAYIQSHMVYGVSKWAGYSDDKALLISSLSSLAGQLTIEVMDGFSSEWGFSWTDLGSNVLGTSLFHFQQKHWKEQKVRMKMSYWPIDYERSFLPSTSSNGRSSLFLRSQDLYGQGALERFLKDYNGQTIWISTNLRNIIPYDQIPSWLAVSCGYSAKNLYGGRDNKWTKDEDTYQLSNLAYPRTRQFIVALDYDLQKIRTKSRFVSSLLGFLNIFKWPAPAISYNAQDKWGFHLVFKN